MYISETVFIYLCILARLHGYNYGIVIQCSNTDSINSKYVLYKRMQITSNVEK